MNIPEWSKKIEYGITNKTYLLKNKNQVLRISTKKITKIIDKNNEIQVLELIKKNPGISTEIIEYHFDNLKNFYLTTKFLPFAYNLIQQSLNNKKISKIYNIIIKFHNINTKNSKVKTFEYKNFIENFKNNIKTPLVELSQYENEIHNIFQNYKPKKMVLSHNDLVPGNFLFNDETDKVYLIDFEYSNINDHLFDIASFISETLSEIKNKNIRNKWTEYWISLFNLDNADKIMIKKWCFYQNVAFSYWANAMYDVTKEKVFLEILKNKFHEVKKMY